MRLRCLSQWRGGVAVPQKSADLDHRSLRKTSCTPQTPLQDDGLDSTTAACKSGTHHEKLRWVAATSIYFVQRIMHDVLGSLVDLFPFPA